TDSGTPLHACTSGPQIAMPGRAGARSLACALADFDIQALDLLVECGEGDPKLLGGFGLVPVAALQLFNDDAPLDNLENIEQRGIWIVLEQRVLKAAPRDVPGEQVGADQWRVGEDHSALYGVFELAHIAGPVVIDERAQRVRGELA